MRERLFCFYGDDFTGSTDALEALASNGVPTVLFLHPPGESELAQFPECRAIGVAGESRSRDPEWMARELPCVFEKLKHYGAPICQYKVCSTFDSSPETGSIGKALEIGQRVFQSSYVPVAVAAPHLRRYVVFGNLFANGGGEIHRIDRHPTMSCHPVTPMGEADLRQHLVRQTSRPSGLIDILALQAGRAQERFDELQAAGSEVIVFDGLDERSLSETGRILWTQQASGPLFAVGSSGLTYALIQYWRSIGLVDAAPAEPSVQPVDRLVVISGSCSPVTESQINSAIHHGFEGFRIEMTALADSPVLEKVQEKACAALQRGRSIVLYTALGPKDCSSIRQGSDLGRSLGIMLRELLIRSGVLRAVIAGGDTSSHAVRELGIHALSFVAPLSPGAPLCLAHSSRPAMDGLEIVLKGGQMGSLDFFETVLRGTI